MGFMGYSTAKLKEKAVKRQMTIDEYCEYLEMKRRTRHWSKKNKKETTDA